MIQQSKQQQKRQDVPQQDQQQQRQQHMHADAPVPENLAPDAVAATLDVAVTAARGEYSDSSFIYEDNSGSDGEQQHEGPDAGAAADERYWHEAAVRCALALL
jgi:hypothetical protein